MNICIQCHLLFSFLCMFYRELMQFCMQVSTESCHHICSACKCFRCAGFVQTSGNSSLGHSIAVLTEHVSRRTVHSITSRCSNKGPDIKQGTCTRSTGVIAKDDCTLQVMPNALWASTVLRFNKCREPQHVPVATFTLLPFIWKILAK